MYARVERVKRSAHERKEPRLVSRPPQLRLLLLLAARRVAPPVRLQRRRCAPALLAVLTLGPAVVVAAEARLDPHRALDPLLVFVVPLLEVPAQPE